MPPLLARASYLRLPETIASVVRTAPDRWVFCGQSGTIYTAATPLGPYSASTRPPEPLTRVVGVPRGLLGLSAAGRLVRYESGGGWSRAADPTDRIFDMAGAGAGVLLGLTAPEGLLVSRDSGRSWSRLSRARPIGARRLVPTARGGVLIQGVHESVHWDGRSDDVQQATDDMVQQLPLAEARLVVPERGPRAWALIERQAAVTGRRYYEAFESAGEPIRKVVAATGSAAAARQRPDQDEEGTRWLWAAGTLDAPLGVRPFPAAERCDSVRLGAHGLQVVMACIHFADDGETIVVEVSASRDGAATWQQVGTLTALDTEQIAVAVAPNGAALLTGVCAEGREPCAPLAPLRLTAGRAPTISRCLAPALTDTPRSPVFSLDGASAFFLGRRSKDDQVALFVSHDGGRSFVPRPLTPPRHGAAPGQRPRWDLGEQLPGRSLHPGREGQLGIVLQLEPPAYVVADGDGRLTHVAQLPNDTLAVSGSGRWVLALGTGQDEGDDPSRLVAWESNDGGLSFQRVAIPSGLLVDEFESLAVRCASAGCVVGDRATRLGWNESEEPSQSLAPVGDSSSPPLQPAIATPFECVLAGGTDWSSLPDVASGGALPGVAQAMRGPTAWSLLQVVDATGEVTAVSAPTDGTGTKLRRQRLFDPVGERSLVAYEAVPQLEGYAAARVSLKGGAARRTLELAWIDYLHGDFARGSLEVAGRMADVTPGTRPTLVTGLLSVSPAGMFVQPHISSPDTYLVPRSGQAPAPVAYPDWRPVSGEVDLHADAVIGQSVPYAVALLRNREQHLLAVGLQRLDGSAAKATFTTVAPPYDELRETTSSFGYLGDTMGVAVHATDTSTWGAWATFSPLASSGRLAAAIALPTQLDLGPVATACTHDQRRGTPRQLAPYVPGTRHPVLVRTLSDSFVLLTDWAVLHGSPAQPCVAAWSAQQLQRTPARPMVALIGGDPARSWLFRPTPGRRGSVDYRSMSCQLAPGTKDLPRQIWLEAGTMRR